MYLASYINMVYIYETLPELRNQTILLIRVTYTYIYTLTKGLCEKTRELNRKLTIYAEI